VVYRAPAGRFGSAATNAEVDSRRPAGLKVVSAAWHSDAFGSGASGQQRIDGGSLGPLQASASFFIQLPWSSAFIHASFN